MIVSCRFLCCNLSLRVVCPDSYESRILDIATVDLLQVSQNWGFQMSILISTVDFIFGVLLTVVAEFSSHMCSFRIKDTLLIHIRDT